MVKFSAAALLVAGTFGLWAHADEIVLLDFASPYCGPCRQMEPTVHGLMQAGYPVRQVDVTREPDLAARFQIDRVPCFVMTLDGQEVERVLGATSGEQLEGMFRRVRNRVAREQNDRVRTQSPDSGPEGVFWTGVRDSGSPGGLVAVDPRVVPTTATNVAPSTPAPHAAAGGPATDQPLLASVRIRVDESDGHSYGTGTIIDARSGEALVITCGHLFRESQGKGPVSVELVEQTADGVGVAQQVPGQVISYDLKRDLGLVSIRPGRPVNAAHVAPLQTEIERGDRVQTVGCDNGQEPSVQSTRVTSVNRYQGPPNIEVDGAPVEGRSGGGLFNADGELIGVCFAADYEGNEGLFTGLQSIHDELDRLGLSDICAASDGAEPADAQELAAVPPVVRGQEPFEPVMPLAEEPAGSPLEVAAQEVPAPAVDAEPAELEPMEQAAMEEIMSRASSAEVICIIRPKEPGGKSEVITLDGVSPEFVRALASRQRDLHTSLSR